MQRMPWHELLAPIVIVCMEGKRIGVMVCKKSTPPNSSGRLITTYPGRLYNCYGRLISVPEDLLTALEHLLTAPEHFRICSGTLS